MKTPLGVNALAVVLGMSWLSGLGCNLVAGIEDVSGTPQDEFAETCLEIINEARTAANAEPFERWIDAESCAAGIAKELSETGSASLGPCDPPSAQLCGPREGTDDAIIHACVDGGGDALSKTREKAACAFHDDGTSGRRVVVLFK